MQCHQDHALMHSILASILHCLAWSGLIGPVHQA